MAFFLMLYDLVAKVVCVFFLGVGCLLHQAQFPAVFHRNPKEVYILFEICETLARW